MGNFLAQLWWAVVTKISTLCRYKFWLYIYIPLFFFIITNLNSFYLITDIISFACYFIEVLSFFLFLDVYQYVVILY